MTTRESTSRRTVWTQWVLCLSLIGLLGSGCDLLGLGGDSKSGKAKNKQQEKAKQQDDKTKAEQPPPEEIAESEEEAPYERPEYPGGTRRNPFLPDLEVIEPDTPTDTGEVRPLEPLERYNLGSLQLVAIISETAVPKAMFIDPEGFGHVVKEGDRIGRNSGEITDIRDNEVEIREITDAEDEKSQTKLKTVQLRSRELDVGGGGGLSEEDREVLQKLLESEQGRQAIEEAYQERAPGAAAAERQRQQGDQQGGGDERFQGLAPPEQ